MGIEIVNCKKDIYVYTFYGAKKLKLLYMLLLKDVTLSNSFNFFLMPTSLLHHSHWLKIANPFT